MNASPDDLDQLLRDYFRAQAPHELASGFPHPEPARSTPLRKSSLARGRLVLAACVVAVLLGFGYMLGGTGSKGGPTSASFSGSSATNVKPHRK